MFSSGDVAPDDLVQGGSYVLEPEDRWQAPVFTFRASDVEAVRARMAVHVIHFEVAPFEQRHAYRLVWPDLRRASAPIQVKPEEVIHVAGGQGLRGGITTRVVDERGGTLALDAFTRGIKHDWSGLHSSARRTLARIQAGEEPNEGPLHALRSAMIDLDGRELDGWLIVARWRLAKGDREGALEPFGKAIEGGRVGYHEPELLPAAAEPLAGLGSTYLELRMLAEARTCFEHALNLRPNHAPALIGLATTASSEPAIVAHALARLTKLGGHDALLAPAAKAIARATGSTAEALLAAATADAPAIDLGTWPWRRAELGDHEHFVERLMGPQEGAVVDEPPVAARTVSDAAAADDEPPPAAEKPWWRFW